MIKITDPNKKGDFGELIAAAWLLSEGYEVFRNVSCIGSINLVAQKGSRIVLINVKTVRVIDGVLQKPSIVSERVSKMRDAKVKVLYAGENGTCAWAEDNSPLKRKCRQCKAEYIPKKKAVFCSEECSKQHFKKNYPEAYNKQQQMISDTESLNTNHVKEFFSL